MQKLPLGDREYFLTKSFVRGFLASENMKPFPTESEFEYRKRVFPDVCIKLDKGEALEFLFGVDRYDKICETGSHSYMNMFQRFSMELAGLEGDELITTAKKIAKGFQNVDPMDSLYEKEPEKA